MYICKWSVSRSDKAKNQIIFFNILRARLGASLNDNFSIEYILPSFALEIYIIDIIWLIFISPRCGVYKSYLWKRPFFPPLWHPTQLRFFKFTWEKRANFRRKRFKICTITYFWRNLARVCRASGIGFPASRALSITGSKSTNQIWTGFGTFVPRFGSWMKVLWFCHQKLWDSWLLNLEHLAKEQIFLHSLDHWWLFGFEQNRYQDIVNYSVETDNKNILFLLLFHPNLFGWTNLLNNNL